MGKILIVDDQKDFLYLLGTLLKDEGFEVIAALDGEDALKKAKEEKPDFIILDVVLPDIDGVTVSRKLKESEETKDIPFAFISGLFTKEKAEEKSYRVDDSMFFAKTGSLKELAAQIKEYCRTNGIAASSK